MSATRSPAGDARSILAAHRLRAARGRRRRRWIGLWLVAAVLISIGSFAAGLLAAPINYNFQPATPSKILLLDDQGHVFASIPPPQQQDTVPSSQIPNILKMAFVAAEDKRFYSENGVDPLAIIRAAWSDVTGGTFSGASTITQQYVKDVYSGTSASRTPLRKLREAALAIRLDSHLSKDTILTRYLNNVYLGNGTVGVEAASEFYYGVPITELGYNTVTKKISQTLAIARSATLAGLGPAPSLFNPVASASKARDREIYVLNQMVSANMISSQTASQAYGNSLPTIVAKAQKPTYTNAPQFRDMVDQELANEFGGASGDDLLYRTGGIQVRTTLDSQLQAAAVAAIAKILPNKTDPDAAVIGIDPRNGDIRALATRQTPAYTANGFDVADPPQGEVERSSGSTIKPFTLAYALEHGHSLDEEHYAPTVAVIPPNYDVHNDEPADTGDYTLERALADSINTIYAPLANQLGLSHVVHLARDSGMDIGHEPGCHPLCPSEALGVPVAPLSEADAYGVFVNGGIHHKTRVISKIVDAEDGELPLPAIKGSDGNRVIPAAVADEVKQAMGEVVTEGTGVSAAQPFPVYGKTGTTTNNVDAWFTGCTPTLCLTVWMGYQQNGNKSMTYDGGLPVYGGTLPAKIFSTTYSNDRLLTAGKSLIAPSPSATPTYTPSYIPPPPVSSSSSTASTKASATAAGSHSATSSSTAKASGSASANNNTGPLTSLTSRPKHH